ncbi:MAG: hypothetical protein ACD_26C00034G0057 [uncultured bacterium]|nr:MAG: hypothetical protein ACD_26C00034G0057 [uncultured bacterium]
MRKLLIFFVCTIFLSYLVPSVFAQKITQEKETVNSFELFWPLVAGKTKVDNYYSLKLFKEKMRGLLIFGKPQKADYSLFISTKRILEAEKLSNEGKKDSSIETYDMALSQLAIVEANINDSGEMIKSSVDNLNLKFDNLETFLPWLVSEYKDQDLKNKTQNVLDKVTELHSKI